MPDLGDPTPHHLAVVGDGTKTEARGPTRADCGRAGDWLEAAIGIGRFTLCE
ncbi:hypothetical protein ACFWD7_57580 [Streptomyces mirabilis]|uniref:hypothetical protein n=1 Tax=Streptomyces mirabilis TaxID=68239 RepID=UPI0036A16551